ncbi:MAG: porin [Phycisphaerales bacterium]
MRAVLLSTGLTADYDDGFFLATPNGDVKLELAGQIQLRYVFRHQNDSNRDDSRGGFEARRTKLKFSGHVLGPDLAYSVTGAFSRRDGRMNVQGAFIRLALADDLRLQVGRARPPLLREETISSQHQLTADRSLVARTFRQDRSVSGVLIYETDVLRVHCGFSDASAGLFGDQSWRASARVELLVKGEWKRLETFTSFPYDEPAVVLGAGVLFQDQDRAQPAEDDARLLRWTVDAAIELGGANISAAIVGYHSDEERHEAVDQYGIVVQGGLFVTDDWEVFARYAWGDANGEAADLSVVTVGVNHYLSRHNLKWSGRHRLRDRSGQQLLGFLQRRLAPRSYGRRRTGCREDAAPVAVLSTAATVAPMSGPQGQAAKERTRHPSRCTRLQCASARLGAVRRACSKPPCFTRGARWAVIAPGIPASASIAIPQGT